MGPEGTGNGLELWRVVEPEGTGNVESSGAEVGTGSMESSGARVGT